MYVCLHIVTFNIPHSLGGILCAGSDDRTHTHIHSGRPCHGRKTNELKVPTQYQVVGMQQPTPDSVHCTGVPTVSRPFPCQLFICSVNLAPKLSVAHFGSVAMLYWWPEAQSAISLCHCMYWLVCSTIYKTATKLPGASQFACCQSSRFFVCFATGTATAATYAENRQKRRMKKMPNKY